MEGRTLKLKLVIAYHGGHFSGWQTQATGQAVQPLIEAAWRALIPGKHNVHGASRTDAGVHAMGMVAHVELPRDLFKLSMRKVPLALNARLPDHVRVVSAHRVPSTFHARYHAVGKEYRCRRGSVGKVSGLGQPGGHVVDAAEHRRGLRSVHSYSRC